MNHKARHKLLTALFTLLWIGSYFLLYLGFGSEIFGSKSNTGLEFFVGGLLIFLAPIIPLWLALFYGRKTMSTKQLAIGLLAIFALLFAYSVIMFIGANSAHLTIRPLFLSAQIFHISAKNQTIKTL